MVHLLQNTEIHKILNTIAIKNKYFLKREVMGLINVKMIYILVIVNYNFRINNQMIQFSSIQFKSQRSNCSNYDLWT